MPSNELIDQHLDSLSTKPIKILDVGGGASPYPKLLRFWTCLTVTLWRSLAMVMTLCRLKTKLGPNLIFALESCGLMGMTRLTLVYVHTP